VTVFKVWTIVCDVGSDLTWDKRNARSSIEPTKARRTEAYKYTARRLVLRITTKNVNTANPVRPTQKKGISARNRSIEPLSVKERKVTGVRSGETIRWGDRIGGIRVRSSAGWAQQGLAQFRVVSLLGSSKQQQLVKGAVLM
jgi:hypothetical protein